MEYFLKVWMAKNEYAYWFGLVSGADSGWMMFFGVWNDFSSFNWNIKALAKIKVRIGWELSEKLRTFVFFPPEWVV